MRKCTSRVTLQVYFRHMERYDMQTMFSRDIVELMFLFVIEVDAT